MTQVIDSPTRMVFYSESNRFETPAIIFSLAILIPVGMVLAHIYTCLIIVMPLVYFNFLASTFYGVVLGSVALMVFRMMRSRSQSIDTILAVLVAVVSWYFSIATYVEYAKELKIPFFDFGNVLATASNPLEVFGIMNLISKYGMWGFGNVPVNGLILWLIWLAEAGLMIGMMVFVVGKSKNPPFSESLRKWYKQYDLAHEFEHISAAKIMERELTDKAAHLVISSLGLGNPNHYSKVSIYYLPDESDQYLSISNHFSSSDGKKNTSDHVFHLMRISTEDAKNILDHFPHNRKYLFL